MKRKRSKSPPRKIYCLYDQEGVWAGTYASYQEADDDAWGPRFRKKYTIHCYIRSARETKTAHLKEMTF